MSPLNDCFDHNANFIFNVFECPIFKCPVLFVHTDVSSISAEVDTPSGNVFSVTFIVKCDQLPLILFSK